MTGFFKTMAITAAALLPVMVVLRLLWRRAARKKGKAPGSPAREVLLCAFALFMAGLLVLVLTPGAGDWPVFYQRLQHGLGVNLMPGFTIGRFMGTQGDAFNINIIGNVAMFVPLGFCLPLFWRRWRSWWKMLLVAVGFPVAIECTQLFINRSVDIDDVILNAAGILLGYGLCRLATWLVKPLNRLCLPAL